MVCGCLLRTQQCSALYHELVLCQFVFDRASSRSLLEPDFNGEFDPGSGRTLAACLTHASRAVRPLRGYTSGERVSNTGPICPSHRDNAGKPKLIPNTTTPGIGWWWKVPAVMDELAAYQLVGGVMAHQG